MLRRPGDNYYGTVDDLSRIFEAEGLVVAPGTVEDLPQIFNEEGLAVTPEVIAEIASIEVLVREFHELRRQEQAGA